MALSYVEYTSDGTTTSWNFPFGYLDPTHVKVFLDGVETTSFSLSSEFQITLDSPAASGVIIRIERVTPSDSRLVDWENNAVLGASDLDTSDLQVFYLVQENADTVSASIVRDVDNKFDAQSLVIKNVADGVDDNDAVNMSQLNSIVSIFLPQAEAARDAAVVAQGLAEAAQNLAELWASQDEDVLVDGLEYSAKHYSLKSSGFATDAETSKDDAEAALVATIAARDAALAALASLTFDTVDISSNTTLDDTYHNLLIAVDSTSGLTQLTLPDATTLTQDIIISVSRVAGANIVRMLPSGSDTIGGESSLDIVETGLMRIFRSDKDNGGWIVSQAGSNFDGTGSNSLQMGSGASATGSNSIALGSYTSSTSANGTAIGRSATNAGTSGLAIGAFASVGSGHSNSAAIGPSSSTDKSNQIKIGSATHEVKIDGTLVDKNGGEVLSITTLDDIPDVDLTSIADEEILQWDSASSTWKNVAVPSAPISPIMIVQDQKASGVAGGTFNSGAWQTRDLNTVTMNTITGASLSLNQITLPAGTYEIEASAPAGFCGAHQARLQNITSGTTQILGDSSSGMYASGTTLLGHTRSNIYDIITLASTTTFEVQHRCIQSRGTDGFGDDGNWGTNIYTTFRAKKLA